MFTPYEDATIGDHQYGFGRNRSTGEHILCVRQILEKQNGNTMKTYISSLHTS